MPSATANDTSDLLVWSTRPDAPRALASGFRLVATRDRDDLVRTLAAAGARAVVVDARDALDEAIEVAGVLGQVRRAMLVLLSAADVREAARFIDRGATHFLAEPWTSEELSAACLFAERLGERSDARAVDPLAADLHRAIARGEVDVLFQPQVAMESGAIVGVEALARWEHPMLGALGAEPLFAAAERAGLASTLSDHVQGLALARAAAWPASLGALRVSVNVTAADLAREDFSTRFLDRARASGVLLTRVTAEITETELIGDLAAAATQLTALRAAGCRVAIDDFGTGYSSLAYLQALPLDALKIDKAITRNIAGSTRDQVIVRAVVAMARDLGLTTVAEGVETTAERDLLAAAGCDVYQGFLCAEALDTTALTRLVAKRVV